MICDRIAPSYFISTLRLLIEGILGVIHDLATAHRSPVARNEMLKMLFGAGVQTHTRNKMGSPLAIISYFKTITHASLEAAMDGKNFQEIRHFQELRVHSGTFLGVHPLCP